MVYLAQVRAAVLPLLAIATGAGGFASLPRRPRPHASISAVPAAASGSAARAASMCTALRRSELLQLLPRRSTAIDNRLEHRGYDNVHIIRHNHNDDCDNKVWVVGAGTTATGT